MRSFNMGNFGANDPWFRVGTVEVTTTAAVVGMGVASMLVWAVEGPSRAVSKYLWLVSRDLGAFPGGSVLEGQVWRLVSWPIPNAPDIWTIVLFAVFFMLGSQLEGLMGRRRYTAYLLAMTIIPAVVVTVFELVTGSDGVTAGLRQLELGVLVGFALQNPSARFWPGIPAWGIAGGIVVLEVLRDVGDRNNYALVMLFSVVAVSLIGLRSMGFAEQAAWIPKVALPAGYRAGTGPKAKTVATSRRKKPSRAKLKVAPTAVPERRDLTRLEEAELDAILEQVSERGLNSLTSEQRRRLEEHSKRLRKRDS